MRGVDRQWFDAEATTGHVGEPSRLRPVLKAENKTPWEIGFPETRHGNRRRGCVSCFLRCQLLECPSSRHLVAVIVEEVPCTLDIGKGHGAVGVEAQMLQHPGHVIVDL